MDKDSPEDMMWICERAIVRADTFGIKGVDYKLTMGVVKNIIPAVASTNALTSAACVNECFKILTGCNDRLDNYMQYLGQTRIAVSQIKMERDPTCIVCARKKVEIQTVKSSETLGEYVEHLKSTLHL